MSTPVPSRSPAAKSTTALASGASQTNVNMIPDLHPDLRADYVLANPLFNDSDTALRGSAFLQTRGTLQVMAERQDNFRKDDDVRWRWNGDTWTTKGCPQCKRGDVHQFGVPPKGNANFSWVLHFIHHLAPQGMAGFVLANGSMSSNQAGEGDIRRALPGQFFYSTCGTRKRLTANLN